MNVLHTYALALLTVAAGIAHASDAPPAPPAAPAPSAPGVPTAPPAPAAPMAPGVAGSASVREQARLERELQRAQEELNRAAHEVAELSTQMREDTWSQFEAPMVMNFPRSILGINIGRGHPDDSTDGVRVLSVSPGGPAERAGLKANDVIVSLAGKELRADKKKSAQQQLLAQMHDTPPGTPVSVEYRRDGKLQKIDVTPKSWPDVATTEFPTGLATGLATALAPLKAMDHGVYWMDRVSGFGSAELADLSPGLGHYFGTDKGLLVVRAPKDDRLKLQDGDVILDIDGRTPGSPSHAYEILASYHNGEALKLHVMRQQKKLELPVEIPDDAHGGMSRLRADEFTHFDLISTRRLADQ